MLPWGHLALGYLCYSLVTRARACQPPNGRDVVFLAVSTQLPDLIDKPLVTVGILPEGRALGHSLLFGIPLCSLVIALTRRTRDRTLAPAVGIGYATHLLGDGLPALIEGDWSQLSFLLWPVLSSPDYPTESLAGHLRRFVEQVTTFEWWMLLDWREYFVVQLWIAGLVTLLWLYDDMPPIGRG